MNYKSDAMAPQARNYRRTAVQLECAVYSDVYGASVALLGSDLSERGVWLDTDLPLDVGTEIGLSFQLPQSEQTLYVNGRVRHIKLFRRSSDPQRAGMGIEFTSLRAVDRRLLTENLHRLGRNRYRALPEEPTVVGAPLASLTGRERRNRNQQTAVGTAAAAADTHYGSSERRKLISRRNSLLKTIARQQEVFHGGLSLAVSILRGDKSTTPRS